MNHTPGILVALEAGVNISPADEHEVHALIGDLPVLICTVPGGHYSESFPDGSPEPEHTVTQSEALANAKRIALAWNAHDDLVEALTELAEYAAAHIGLQVPDCVAGPISKARGALAKAKGEA